MAKKQLDEGDESELELVFNHQEKPASYFRLFQFTGIALLGFAGFFYLFKVVTPVATRKKPGQQHLTLLQAGDPAAQRLIFVNETKFPLGLIPGNTFRRKLEEPQVPERQRQPSYLTHKALPQLTELSSRDLPSLLPAQPLLPPLAPDPFAGVETPNAVAGPPVGSQLRLPGSLAGRKPLKPWGFSPQLPQEEPTHLHDLCIQVMPDGQVTHVISNSPNCEPALILALKKLRFPPVAAPAPLWADVEVVTFAK